MSPAVFTVMQHDYLCRIVVMDADVGPVGVELGVTVAAPKADAFDNLYPHLRNRDGCSRP